MEIKNNYTIEEVGKKISEFSEYDDAKGAYDYYKELKRFVKEESLRQLNPELYGKYYKNLVKLKFLALNILDDWTEVEDLIKNHFETIYELNYYNLWEKIKIDLLTVPVLEDRDKIKEEIRKILLECSRAVIEKKNYNDLTKIPITVAEWLRDYISNLGNKEVDNLKRVQYLTNSDSIKKLTKEDKSKLKILFDLYENLKLSSISPKGFEGDIPMVIDGKYVIFRGGEAEEVPVNIIDIIKRIKLGNESSSQVDELKQMVTQYPVGSLERKAIEEELEKLAGGGNKNVGR